MKPYAIYIGYDPSEDAAFAVARDSCRHLAILPIPINGLFLEDLIKLWGIYSREIQYRPTAADKPIMWDVPSDAPMSTQHANARFFVPYISGGGWAMFTEGDVLFQADVTALFPTLDPNKAVYCVKHVHAPMNASKMDGQVQTSYSRKNWSSVMIFNCDHRANMPLYDLDFLNTTPGRDLHRFCWLQDDQIGELDQSWNYLVGHTDKSVDPKIIHWTDGVPNMPGFENAEYADMWRNWRDRLVRG
jgi:hypothetical protein